MKYQLHCPKCNHEFAYDADYYDKNIARLGAEIHDLIIHLTNYKTLPKPEKERRKDWYIRAKQLLAEKNKAIGELKAIRKVADQQLKHAEYTIFKMLVKDMVGEDAFHDLIDKANKEMEAYKVSGLMWHEYSKSNSKANVISINKI